MCRISWGIRDRQADEQESERISVTSKAFRHLYQTKLIITGAVISILPNLIEQVVDCGVKIH